MEKILEELLFLRKLLTENPALRRFLESSHIPQEEKFKLVKKVLSPLLTKTSLNFLLLLGRKFRLLYLPEIIEEYQRLHDADLAIQRTDVITVSPLDDALLERLHQRIERIMKKSVKLCCYIDPRILGGIIIRTPNLIIDGSVRKQLVDIRYALTALKV